MPYEKVLIYISRKNAEAARILAAIPARDRSEYVCQLILADQAKSHADRVRASLKAALVEIEAEETANP